MVYITKTNTEIDYCAEHNPLRKSISMFLLDRGTYDTNKILDVIWKHAGFLCIKVAFNHEYRNADGQLAHTYDLYFRWGRFGGLDVTNKHINEIMHAIEQELSNHIPVDLRGRTHGVNPTNAVNTLFEKHTGLCEFYRKNQGKCTCGAVI